MLTVLQFIVYALWMVQHDAFKYVIYDYGPTMLAVIILQLVAFFREGAASAFWLISGILVSFAAAGIQLSGFTLHEHFNHNDLYHVIQMAAMVLIYRGAVLLQDHF